MDIQTVRARLIAEGFRPDSFDLGDAKNPSEVYALHQRDGAWVIFYAERGLERSPATFDSLEPASKELLRRLREDPSTRLR